MLFKTTFQTTCTLLNSTLHSNKIDYPWFSINSFWNVHAVDIVKYRSPLADIPIPSPDQSQHFSTTTSFSCVSKKQVLPSSALTVQHHSKKTRTSLRETPADA